MNTTAIRAAAHLTAQTRGRIAALSTALATQAANAEERLADASAWVRMWTPGVLLQWLWRHRLIAAALLALSALILGAARAWADPGTGATALNEGNPLISWMGIKDSDGVPIAKYTLSIDEGGLTKPHIAAFAAIDSAIYEIYLCYVATALWLIKKVLGFEWLGLFTKPFETIGGGIESAMDKFGLAPTALAVLAIIVACSTLIGKVAKAASNIAMGLLMVGLAATIFANPLAELIGPNGLLAKGRDTGMEISTSVSGGTGANVDNMIAQSADRFVRSPTQTINYGMVSDSISRKCKEAFTEGMKKGRGDELKDDMKNCDKDHGKDMHKRAMANPVSIFVSLSMFQMLGAFLIAFACYFAWHVVRAAVQAMLFAALAPPAFAFGIIPGGPQMFAFKTVLDCAMAYIAMIIYTAAFGAYNVVLDNVYRSTGNPIEAVFLTALVLAIAFAFFSPLRRMFDQQRDKIAAKFSSGSSAGSSANRLSKVADMMRIKQEIGDQFGWGKNRGSHRDPGRVDTQTGEGPVGPPLVGHHFEVSNPDIPPSAGPDPSSTPPPVGGNSSSPGSPAPQSAPAAPTRTYDGEVISRKRTHDRLAQAIQLQRSMRGGASSSPAGGPGGGMVRHSLSEAA